MKNVIFKTVVAIGMILSAQTISAQEKVEIKKQRTNGGFGHFSFTGQNIDFGSLNNTISNNGYGKFDATQGTWGGGGCFVINNFILGGEGAGLFASSVSNPSNSIEMSGGYGTFNFGYMLHHAKRSALYSTLGAGVGGFNFIVNQKGGNTDFNQQINTPSGAVTMNAGGALFNAQIAYQYFFCGKQTTGFFVGMKAGYRYSPSAWKLNVNGNNLDGGPTVNMNGAFVTVILGGGFLGKK
jgi:hypothetical protein